MAYTLDQLMAPGRIARFVSAARDVRAVARPAIATRVPVVDAETDELTMRFTPLNIIADVVANGAPARTRSHDPIDVLGFKPGNIKLGLRIDQKRIELLRRITATAPTNALAQGDLRSWDSYLARTYAALVNGVRARADLLVCQMLQDTSTYSNFGVSWSSMTWGMPSDLKTTLSGNRRWLAGNESTALPLTDIMTLRRAARNYGVVLDRVTLAETALLFAVTTNEVRNAAQLRFPNNLNAALALTGTFATQDLAGMVGQLLGMTVEVEDAQYTIEDQDGTTSTARYLPDTRVVLTSTAFDNNPDAWDLGNVVVDESIVGAVMGAERLSAINEPTRGPVGYVTAPADLNPPAMTAWCVQKAFPRRHMPACSAVLTLS